MKRRAALLALLMLAAAPAARAADTRDPDSHFFSLNAGDLKEELAHAVKSGKRGMLLFFEQDGCPGCLYMKKNVLNRADVQDHYRARLASFSVNIFGAVPVRDLAGRDLNEKSLAQALGVKATPTFIYYDAAGKEAARITGPVKDPAEFMLLAEYTASGAWKTGKFADYKSSRLKR